jgi:hypothetical protein
MKVKLKSKISKKGEVSICIIDSEFPPNNDEIPLNNPFKKSPFESIKVKKYYKISNIGIDLEKDNIVPYKYKEKLTNDIVQFKEVLSENGIKVIEYDDTIKYKESPKLKPQSRNSCEEPAKFFGCL